MIQEIQIPKIDWDMPITDLIMEMEKLRYKIVDGTTPPYIFYQIRGIFQMMESIGSSRIEGNNTTIMDYVESTKITSESSTEEEKIEEIKNIEEAMRFIESNIDETPISLHFIRELHSLTVKDLSPEKEGAKHPGAFRTGNVRISGSSHTPPDSYMVEPLMRELVEFINSDTPAKYDLIKIAIAHHRFVWIHPFENGNGRVVRLFTYALLLKFVFKSKDRIINPTAVFCSDRNEYYKYLSMADNDPEEGMLAWAEYMLKGLKIEIEKLDKLLDYRYLQPTILRAALKDALDRKYITDPEYKILTKLIDQPDGLIQSSDISPIFPDKSSSDRSRMIKALVDKRMLRPISENARRYLLSFENNFLLRSILTQLDKNGFLPEGYNR